MQNQNLLIYSAAQADASNNGPWIDVSNLVAISVQANNYVAGKTDIQVSNDPNVMIDGAAIGPPSAPVLSQFASIPNANTGLNLSPTPPGDVSMLPATTFFVEVTFVTKWGETTASASSSLAVTAGNYLFVAAPVPTLAQQPYVTGWNVYVSLTGGAGTYVLQTGPQYSPQRLIDGIGSVSILGGGTVNPLGPNQSTRFAISGALPLITNVIGGVVKVQGQNFSMLNGFQLTEWVPPATDQSGSANSGVSVSNGAGVDTLTTGDLTSVAVFVAGGNWMWSASNLTWKFLRVTNGSSAPGTTVAYLEGLRG
jgi:hypothetical protein